MSANNYFKIINRAVIFSYRPVTLVQNDVFRNRFVVPQGRKFLSIATETTETYDSFNSNRVLFERAYFRTYLNNNPKYKNLIFEPKISVTKNSCESLKLLKGFDEDPNKNDRLTELSDLMKQEISDLSFDELLEVTYLLLNCRRNSETEKDTIWIDLTKDINNELLKRYKKPFLSCNEIIKCYDVIYHSPYKKNFSFYYFSLLKLISRANCLTIDQTLLMFYYMTSFNEEKIKQDKFKLNVKVASAISDFTLQELALAFKGFSSLKLKFTHPDVIPQTVEKLLNNIEELDSVLLKVICVGLAVQPKNSCHKELISNFQEKIIPYISKFHPSSLLSLLLSNASNCELNFTLAENVLKIVKENIELCTPQVLERFLFLAVCFNIEDRELINLAIKEFESLSKKYDRINFHSSLVRFLSHLIHFQVYPENLIRFAMTPEFVCNLMSCSQNRSSVAWDFVNGSLELEKPEYHCTGLSTRLRKKIFQIRIYALKPERNRVFFYSTNYFVHNNLTAMYGDEYVSWIAPLLHCSEIVLMIFDRNFKPQPIPKEFKTLDNQDFKTLKPLDNENFWICFISLTYESFTPNKELNFVAQTKIRQFCKAGFKPVVVEMNKYKTHRKNNTTDTFLKDIITKKITELVDKEKLKMSA